MIVYLCLFVYFGVFLFSKAFCFGSGQVVLWLRRVHQRESWGGSCVAMCNTVFLFNFRIPFLSLYNCRRLAKSGN